MKMLSAVYMLTGLIVGSITAFAASSVEEIGVGMGMAVVIELAAIATKE